MGLASGRAAAESLSAIDDAMSSGQLLAAYDLACTAASMHGRDPTVFQHRAVLALLRAGMWELGEQRYREFGLEHAQPENAQLRTSMAALGARLLKDRADWASGPDAASHFAEAARSYNTVFKQTDDAYAGINAATLLLWSGDVHAAQQLARVVLPLVSGRDYFSNAIRAEAFLLLGDLDRVTEFLSCATRGTRNFQEWAVTRRQLARTCGLLGYDPSVLAPLTPPPIIHFVGHMPGARLDLAFEAGIAAAIGEHLELLDVRFAYGALAAGADIIFAESLISRGAEVHIVLPFDPEDFCRVSVAPAGPVWVDRYRACLARARLHLATTDLHLGDDALFNYGTRYAMGLALQHARFLDAAVHQIAVWDQLHSESEGGTADAIAIWQELRRPQITMSPQGETQQPRQISVRRRRKTKTGAREIRGALFGDVSRYGRLKEAQGVQLLAEAMKHVAAALRPFSKHILYKNTWGDALFLIIEDAMLTAEVALVLEETWKTIDFPAYGLPSDLGLRLGVTMGPVRRFHDPILDRTNFVGTHITEAARIEPIVPVGMTYATEALAAMLELDGAKAFRCEYIGTARLTKDAGLKPLYRLRRNSPIHS